MPDFIPGLELAGRFYTEAVRPLLDQHFPYVRHSAALIGSGSEVLGFDTPMSSDHHWGPRVMLFLSEADYARHADSIREKLAHTLPSTFLGFSTHFVVPADDESTTVMEDPGDGPIQHRVEVFEVGRYLTEYLGFNPVNGVSLIDWLVTPQQILRTVVAGRVYHDGLGVLAQARDALAYYPDQVWRYLLAAQWRRIDQEEPMMGRTGYVGDDIGSHIVAMRQVREVMCLCFLMERQYAPYIKWFGTAFGKLKCAPLLEPHIKTVMYATDWQGREAGLTPIYETVARMHNDLGITEPMPTRVSNFFNRPFKVIHSGKFVEAIRATITDADVLGLPPSLGSVDQWADSTDVLSYTPQYRQLVSLYQ